MVAVTLHVVPTLPVAARTPALVNEQPALLSLIAYVTAPSPLPLVPVLQEEAGGWAAGWLVQDIFRDLPMDALTLLENVLDVSHVPFTHHATVG